MSRPLICCLLVVISIACRGHSAEDRFFEGDIATRMERLQELPLQRQWQIFLYGNQVIHPPATGLALPIAKQGKTALDYVLGELKHPKNELDLRDSMVVFQTMQWGGYYDICGDAAAMATIIENSDRITDPDWRAIYRQMLVDLCRERASTP